MKSNSNPPLSPFFKGGMLPKLLKDPSSKKHALSLVEVRGEGRFVQQISKTSR
jgi:hypothetical protein